MLKAHTRWCTGTPRARALACPVSRVEEINSTIARRNTTIERDGSVTNCFPSRSVFFAALPVQLKLNFIAQLDSDSGLLGRAAIEMVSLWSPSVRYGLQRLTEEILVEQDCPHKTCQYNDDHSNSERHSYGNGRR